MPVNPAQHSLIKVIFAMVLCLVLVSSLAVATFAIQGTQNIQSQAAEKMGTVTLTLMNQTEAPKAGQPVTVAIKANGNAQQFNYAMLGIRFQGVLVKDIVYKPASKSVFRVAQTPMLGKNAVSGIDIKMGTMDTKLITLPADSTLGTVTFTPAAVGTLYMYFETNSHVYAAPLRPAASANPKTGDENLNLITEPNGQSKPLADLLQYAASLKLEIGGHVAQSPNPSNKAPVYCKVDGTCPSGFSCIQPPMAACPAGQMCAQVMPRRICVAALHPGTKEPRPNPTPTPPSNVIMIPFSNGGVRY